MPKNRVILTLADLFSIMEYIRVSSELFQVPTDKILQRKYKSKLNALGITIAQEENLSVGAFQTLAPETRLKPKSRKQAAELLAWLREMKLHP